MCYFREPKTTQERRELGTSPHNGTDYDGYVVRSRAKRSMNAIPNAWDDLPRCRLKNWKKHRKTQYRRIKDMSRD